MAARGLARRSRGPLPGHRPRHADRRPASSAARAALEGRSFCATYADGVADIDLGRLLDFHREHGDLATMTVVRPELQFGVAELNGDGRVRGFREKPRARALGQRRLLLLRARGAGLHRRRLGPRARAARAAGRRRAAARLPPRGLLGVHGHLQGRGPAQRRLGSAAARPGRSGPDALRLRHGRLRAARHRRSCAALLDAATSRSRSCAATQRRARPWCSTGSRSARERGRRAT